MPFETIYDISGEGFEWWWSAIPAAFVLFGVWLVRREKKARGVTSREPFGWVLIILGGFLTVILLGGTYEEYRYCRDAFARHRFEVVEGPVEDFQPAYSVSRSARECFRVEGKRFCYSEFGATVGFRTVAASGSPIRNGRYVRVSFVPKSGSVDKYILKLEMRLDTPASASQPAIRSAEDVRRELRNQPMMQRFRLVFSFLALYLWVWAVSNWRPLADLFLAQRAPELQKRILPLWRGLVAAWIVPTVYFIFVAARDMRPSPRMWVEAFFLSLVVLGFFWVADKVQNRANKSSGWSNL